MTELLPLMTYSLVMSSTPGPNNMLLTASGANFGYRRSLPHILGIGFGHGVQIFVTCLGLGSLFVAYPLLHSALRVVGAAYLLILAWKLTGSAIAASELARPLSFAQAAAFQAVNPKNWIKSITVASVFMPSGVATGWAAAIVLVVTVAINFPCVSMWTLFGVAIRRLLTEPRRRRQFNLAMAGVLLLLAVSLVAR
ncbi:MAG: LysE family translocator [Betaproteobacteria bacterium]|nr:MAG: LysE family translocator [Betaproteobacteria bacterium]